MIALIKKLAANRLLPFGWTVLIIILLCLPGSAIPGNGLFGFKHLDKIVHIILFGINVLLWGLYYRSDKKAVVIITILSIAFGIAMEYVQLNFVPNRSFDIGDIIADTAGALIGAILLRRIDKNQTIQSF